MLKSVYKDYSPVVASIGQTLNIPLPASITSQVANVGVGDPTFTDVVFSTKSIVFNQSPQWGALIRDFEQYNSPLQIRNLIVDQAVKGIREAINAYVCGLITAGNFPNYVANSTTASDITPAQFLTSLSKLADAKVPVNDIGNMSLLVSPKVYYGMLGDANWTSLQIVGQNIAERAHEAGVFPTVYGVDVKLDQGMTTTGTAPSRTFTGLLMHKYAIALATRPLPPPDAKVADYAYVMVDDVPARVTLAYSPLKSGWTLNVDAGFGAAVVRPEAGALQTTAE